MCFKNTFKVEIERGAYTVNVCVLVCVYLCPCARVFVCAPTEELVGV